MDPGFRRGDGKGKCPLVMQVDDNGSKVSRLFTRWNLTPDGAETVTPRATLLPVRRGGEPAMLKLMGPLSDEGPSARALRHFAARGAVRVLAEDDGAILLERAVPGTTLTDVVADGRDDEATAIVANVTAAVHYGDTPDGFQSLEDWGDGFRRQRERGAHLSLPSALLARAEGVWRELAASQGRRYLLHGDLHHDNILLGDRGWLAIDPKGIVGEAAFEPAAMLRNPVRLWPFSADAKRMKRRMAILCERLSLDRERVIGWTFGLMVLGACWSIEDGDSDSDVARATLLGEIAAGLM
jgi:streptomycin 6-kinase